MEVLQQLAVLRPGQNGVGVERLFDRQTLVVVEGLGALGGRGRHAEIVALGPHVERFRGEPGLVQHGGQRHTGPLAGAEDHPFLGARGFGALRP